MEIYNRAKFVQKMMIVEETIALIKHVETFQLAVILKFQMGIIVQAMIHVNQGFVKTNFAMET